MRQSSFFRSGEPCGYIEHIIRDREDYETRIKYIYENPIRWYYNKLYTEIDI